MCGFVGIIDRSGQPIARVVDTIDEMSRTLVHRGPDDGAVWFDQNAGVVLGHRRLSILDLSEAGRQPMISHDGRFAVAFNGEIYNHRLLREEIERLGVPFRSRSDTEVLVEALSAWGIERTLPKLNGMFAFAAWDRRSRCLHLARDRLGEKPLYYGDFGRIFLFGSELKALAAHPDFQGEVDRDVLAAYLRFNCIPAPHSVFKGVHKLPPASFLTVNAADPARAPNPPRPYWQVQDIVERGMNDPVDAGEAEIVDALDALLTETVQMRMAADVPLGAFLSGGIDSSTVTALMQKVSSRPVRTFTMGFDVPGYDEAPIARAVARQLGTEHTEVYVSPEQARDVIPLLPDVFDEPFSDSSQIPTYLVAQIARRHVTVSLSGDGGDEVFGGYNRYLIAGALNGIRRWIPRPLKRLAASGITAVAPSSWDAALRLVERVVPRGLRPLPPGDRLHKLAAILPLDSPVDVYQRLISHWEKPESILTSGAERPSPAFDSRAWPAACSPVELMMYLDLIGYLPDDILVKLDRTSMASSLEARVPFLDHRVVEFAWKLPLGFKVNRATGKLILRKVLERYVPKPLWMHPKMGFNAPLDHWLRGPLRDWAEDLLDADRLRSEGFFRADPIRQKWREHLSGRRNWQFHLWDILMFQAWHARWTTGRTAPARQPLAREQSAF